MMLWCIKFMVDQSNQYRNEKNCMTNCKTVLQARRPHCNHKTIHVARMCARRIYWSGSY